MLMVASLYIYLYFALILFSLLVKFLIFLIYYFPNLLFCEKFYMSHYLFHYFIKYYFQRFIYLILIAIFYYSK